MAIEFIDYVHRNTDQTRVLWEQMDETLKLLPYPLIAGFTRKQSLLPLALGMIPGMSQVLKIGARKSDRIGISNTGPGYLSFNAWHYLRCRGKKTAYLCDVWPDKFRLLIKLASVFGLNPVFVSYRESAERLAQLDRSRTYLYVPEGLPAGHYPSDPHHERQWDVVSFGRKWIDLHNRIKPYAEEAGIRYLFRDDGQPVGTSHADLMAVLGQTKISICAPRGVTNPDFAGGINAMTLRFLQSMACECLVLGRAPQDMVDLFGYNPVVHADLDDPIGQIREILDHFDDYLPLIRRNSQTLREHHLWSHRVVDIARILKEDFQWDIVQPHFVPPLSLDQRQV